MASKLRVNLGTFNLAKGIGMLCFIFAHMTSRYSLENVPELLPLYLLLQVFSAGLLPMFFIITGYGFKDKPAKAMLKKSFSEMVIPFLWGAAGCIVLFPLLWYFFTDFGTLVYCTKLTILAFAFGLPKEKELFGYTTFTVQALWFLLAMFIAMNLLSFIVKRKKTSTQVLLSALCAALGFLLVHFGITYYCLPQGLLSVPFCYIGYTIKQRKLLEPMMYSKWTWILLIPVYLLMVIFGRFDMASGKFGVWEYLGACCSGVLYLLLGVYSGRFTWKGLDWLKKIGMHSYWIFCLHGVEMLVVPYDVMVEALSGYHPLIAFCIEVILKIVILSTGCTVLKKISQNKYKKKRMELYGK